MREEDKATTTIPQSPAQDLIATVDRRDKLVRTFEVAMLLVLVLFNVFIAVQTLRTQQTIAANQAANIQRIEGRNKNLQDYLTCVLQIQIADRNQQAFDNCAKSTQH